MNDNIPAIPQPTVPNWQYKGIMSVGTSVTKKGYKENEFGSMFPVYTIPNYVSIRTAYIYYEAGRLVAADMIEAIEIDGVILRIGTYENSETSWLLAANPFEGQSLSFIQVSFYA
jgi:hypothetical protein